MNIRLPFGKTTLEFRIPSSWTDAGILQPVAAFPEIDLEFELQEMLVRPNEERVLSQEDFSSKRVCVVVDDATRPTPAHRIFPVLLRFLKERGLREENTTVLVACGTHAPMSEGKILERLGISACNAIRILNHDCFSQDALVFLGTSSSGMRVSINRAVMEADSLFLVGTIEPHIMAGFGGGAKNLVPGCAGIDTIMDTHLLGPAPERFGNVGRDVSECAVRQRIDEAARMLGKECFLVNTVLDPLGKPVGLFCGDPAAAFREGCALARTTWGAAVSARADVLVLSSNPMNHDLCQASKAFGTGVGAVKEGGLLIACLSVENGLGDYCVPPSGMSYEETRDRIREIGVEDYVLEKERVSGRRYSFYERFLTHSNGEALRKAEIYLYCPGVPRKTLESFGFFKVFDDMGSLLAEAEKLFPEANVLQSPYGGVCFPYFEKE